MADVDMTDAPSGSTAPVKKGAGKGKIGAADAGGSDKKRFEVKKARYTFCPMSSTDGSLVECSSSMGMGYCRGQLCHLQKPHYGSL